MEANKRQSNMLDLMPTYGLNKRARLDLGTRPIRPQQLQQRPPLFTLNSPVMQYGPVMPSPRRQPTIPQLNPMFPRPTPTYPPPPYPNQYVAAAARPDYNFDSPYFYCNQQQLVGSSLQIYPETSNQQQPLLQELPQHTQHQQVQAVFQKPKEQQSHQTQHQTNRKVSQPASQSADRPREPPKSLRVLTGTVEKVVNTWSRVTRVTGNDPILYEVIGIVDREVRYFPESTMKRFLVSDNESGPKLTVEFYEIDRPLPDLQPGDVVKVVGAMRGRILQAFRVDKSSQAELDSSQRVVYVCDRTVADMVRQ